MLTPTASHSLLPDDIDNTGSKSDDNDDDDDDEYNIYSRNAAEAAAAAYHAATARNIRRAAQSGAYPSHAETPAGVAARRAMASDMHLARMQAARDHRYPLCRASGVS